MEYEFCDSPYGGYTVIAHRNREQILFMTTQVFRDTIGIQCAIRGDIYGCTFENSSAHPSKADAQLAMLHWLSFGWDCECIPEEVADRIRAHLISEIRVSERNCCEPFGAAQSSSLSPKEKHKNNRGTGK
jgi:hypothetical protein